MCQRKKKIYLIPLALAFWIDDIPGLVFGHSVNCNIFYCEFNTLDFYHSSFLEIVWIKVQNLFILSPKLILNNFNDICESLPRCSQHLEHGDKSWRDADVYVKDMIYVGN